MVRLEVNEIIAKIESEETFDAVAADYSFTLKIDKYVPYVCAAIHDGHHFRKELWENCLHTEYDRWFEEDPATKNMVISLPILLAGCDSRFEYDLNRSPEEAVFKTAWGKTLWRHPLPKDQINRSLKKHKIFYQVTHALISKIEKKFGMAIVYDMHSFNWRRWEREVPTWNLGTSNIDNIRYGPDIELWRNMLSKMILPNGIKSDADINNTFYGNGYFLKYITRNFKNTLVLATEIAKIYCDEHDQIIYPEVVTAVERQLRELILEHSDNFMNRHIN